MTISVYADSSGILGEYKQGWTKITVKPGDVITGVGYQFRDGQKIIRLEKVTCADGKEFSVYGR